MNLEQQSSLLIFIANLGNRSERTLFQILYRYATSNETQSYIRGTYKSNKDICGSGHAVPTLEKQL